MEVLENQRCPERGEGVVRICPDDHGLEMRNPNGEVRIRSTACPKSKGMSKIKSKNAQGQGLV